jgi:hypothetical protein
MTQPSGLKSTKPDPMVLQYITGTYQRAYEPALKKKATWKPAERAKIAATLARFAPVGVQIQNPRIDFHSSGARAGSFSLAIHLPNGWDRSTISRAPMDETQRNDWDNERRAVIVDALIAEGGYPLARVVEIYTDRPRGSNRNQRMFRIRVGAIPAFTINDPAGSQLTDDAYGLYSRIRMIATAEMKFRIDHARPHNCRTIINLAAAYVARREEVEITLADAAIERLVIAVDSALDATAEKEAFQNNQGRIHIIAPNAPSVTPRDVTMWRIEISYKAGYNRPAKYVGEFDDPRDAARIVMDARAAKDELAHDADYIRLLESAFRVADKIATDATE